MKSLYLFLITTFLSFSVFSQVAKTGSNEPDPKQKVLKVKASCGECNFDLPGDGCDLAVQIKGKSYYVDGVDIKEYGHPHAEHGFCVAVRKAEVQGEIVDGRFKATYFKLLPQDPKKKDRKSKH